MTITYRMRTVTGLRVRMLTSDGKEHGLLCRANRPAPELEAIIGYFVNPVALRTQLEGSLTFREALQRVRDTVVGAQANAEVACPPPGFLQLTSRPPVAFRLLLWQDDVRHY